MTECTLQDDVHRGRCVLKAPVCAVDHLRHHVESRGCSSFQHCLLDASPASRYAHTQQH